MALAFPYPFLLAASTVAEPISIQTALLLILGGALLFTIRAQLALQRRVDSLAATTARRKAKPPTADGAPISPELLAVITAAAHEVLGPDHRIVSIAAESRDHLWSMEGRRQIFSSRKVR